MYKIPRLVGVLDMSVEFSTSQHPAIKREIPAQENRVQTREISMSVPEGVERASSGKYYHFLIVFDFITYSLPITIPLQPDSN